MLILNEYDPSDLKSKALNSLLFLTLSVVLGLALFNLIGLYLMQYCLQTTEKGIMEVISNPQNSPNSRFTFLAVQGIISLGTFVIVPFLFLRYHENTYLEYQPQWKNATLRILLPIFILVLIVMPANSWIMEMNQNFPFPDGFKQWALTKENSLKELTKFLTDLNGFGEISVGFLVIAIIPAIGEELIFRGIVQRKLQIIFSNPHIGIVLAGILFSAIHIQFYGFFPRMALGVLFGYLYFYSGNIFLPIFAHFVNNGFTLLMVLLSNKGLIDFDIENEEPFPIWLAILSLGVAFLLFLFIRKKIKDVFIISK